MGKSFSSKRILETFSKINTLWSRPHSLHKQVEKYEKNKYKKERKSYECYKVFHITNDFNKLRWNERRFAILVSCVLYCWKHGYRKYNKFFKIRLDTLFVDSKKEL